MNCLQDIICGKRVIIGVRDYDACVAPESDLFINDVPGISLKMASKVASEEYQNGADLLNKKIVLATKMVFDEFKQKISPYFDFDAIPETREINNFSSTSILPPAPLSRGLILKRWRSELAQIYVESVFIKTNNVGAATLNIIDGADTISFPVVLVAGETIEIFTNYKAKSEQIKIVLDNTLLDVYTCDINNFGSSCGSCSGRGGKGFVINGWNGTAEDSKCYGIGVLASVRCYEENIICSLLPRMYFLLWQKAAIEILKEHIYGERINPLVNLTKEKAKENRSELEKEYSESYESFAKSIYNYLRQTKGECITCNGNRYEQKHP